MTRCMSVSMSSCKMSTHEFAGRLEVTYLDQIDLGESLVIPRLLDVENGDDVLVVEVPQELHLSQCPQTEHGMVKWCDLLDGNLLA